MITTIKTIYFELSIYNNVGSTNEGTKYKRMRPLFF